MIHSKIIEQKCKHFTEDSIWHDRVSNYSMVASIHFDSNKRVTDFNTNININGVDMERIVLDNLFDYLEQNNYKRLVIFTRTDKEVGNDYNIPSLNFVRKLEHRCRENSMNFYNFIQNPFPDTIPKFDLDDDTFALRFGFDNGCEIDKTAVTKSIVESKDKTTHDYIIMIGKGRVNRLYGEE